MTCFLCSLHCSNMAGTYHVAVVSGGIRHKCVPASTSCYPWSSSLTKYRLPGFLYDFTIGCNLKLERRIWLIRSNDWVLEQSSIHPQVTVNKLWVKYANNRLKLGEYSNLRREQPGDFSTILNPKHRSQLQLSSQTNPPESFGPLARKQETEIQAATKQKAANLS